VLKNILHSKHVNYIYAQTKNNITLLHIRNI